MPVEVSGIHAQDARLGKSVSQQICEVRTVLDEREVCLSDALIEHGLGKHAGAGAEFKNVSGVTPNFSGHQPGEGSA